MKQTTRVSLQLQGLADAISQALEMAAGKPLAFVLMVSVDNTTQYVSNAKREDGKELIESLLERWSQGHADIPAHNNPELKK